MKPIEQCTVGIVGMGLMGGAIAKALRNCCGVPQDQLLACDINDNALSMAKAAGLIAQGWLGGSTAAASSIGAGDGSSDDGDADNSVGEMLKRCDVVFLCLGPAATVRFLDIWEPFFKPGALVTDVAGVKGGIVARAEQLRTDIEFIPGHPMAGAEGGGFAAASRCDFRGKNYILTPLARNKPENIDFLKDIVTRMGFSRITETDSVAHDQKIAFTSQLCHVIAAALVDSEADTAISRFGGGSFEDLTRIAMFNAPMWAELFSGNREFLLERLDQFEGSLGEIRNLIRDGKTAELEKRLAHVRERRAAMDKKP